MKRVKTKTARIATDLGTPEASRRRLEQLGQPIEGWPDIDSSLAESAIGRLLFRGYLGRDYDRARRLYEAGVTFCGWWTMVYPNQGTVLGRLQPGSGMGELDTGEAEAKLKRARAVLAKRRAVYDAVVNVAVYQRFAQPELLVQGLRELVDMQRVGA